MEGVGVGVVTGVGRNAEGGGGGGVNGLQKLFKFHLLFDCW